MFEALYKQYRRRLRGFILSIVRNEASIDEVFDDVMITVWNKIHSFEARSKLSTWIFGIAHRCALKARQKLNRVIGHMEIDQCAELMVSFDPQVDANSTAKVIQKALKSLPPEQEAVVRLAYFHEMAYREIGEVLGCPVETIKTRMHYARKKLILALGGSVADWT